MAHVAAAKAAMTSALLLLLAGCAGCAAPSEAKNASRGVLLPLAVARASVARGRSLLRSGAFSVAGAIREGYFSTQLSVGTPPRNYSLIIDTGSTITYIPCAGCRHCGEHADPAFNPALSSTSALLGCGAKGCECGSPSCSCVQERCYYQRRYAELSSSEGWLVSDVVHLPDGGAPLPLVFGCEDKETGAIYKQRADGVLGMGNAANALPQQLARSGALSGTFALCYGFPSGGALLLGEVTLPPPVPAMMYTPLLPQDSHYYAVTLLSISLGGSVVHVPKGTYERGYGAVLDSGTTFTYLPSAAFVAFRNAVAAAAMHAGLHRAQGADPQYDDVCWRGAAPDFEDIGDFFPSGEVAFGGGAALALTPQRYLFAAGRGLYCLGVFDNGDEGSLLGGILTRNALVQYDHAAGRVGFAEADCSNLVGTAAAVNQGTTEVAGGTAAAAEAAAGEGTAGAAGAAAPGVQVVVAHDAAGGNQEDENEGILASATAAVFARSANNSSSSSGLAWPSAWWMGIAAGGTIALVAAIAAGVVATAARVRAGYRPMDEESRSERQQQGHGHGDFSSSCAAELSTLCSSSGGTTGTSLDSSARQVIPTCAAAAAAGPNHSMVL